MYVQSLQLFYLIGIVHPGTAPFTEKIFAAGRNAGFNTFRFFALGNNNDNRNNSNRLHYALQPTPGSFEDTTAK